MGRRVARQVNFWIGVIKSDLGKDFFDLLSQPCMPFVAKAAKDILTGLRVEPPRCGYSWEYGLWGF